MKQIFKKGDLVRLKVLDNYPSLKEKSLGCNVFLLKEISDIYGSLSTSYIAALLEECDSNQIPLSEIEPIPIDGISDKNICYEYAIAANTYAVGEPTRVTIVDRSESYYYETLKNEMFDDKSLSQLVQEGAINFVHEVQHLFPVCFRICRFRLNKL